VEAEDEFQTKIKARNKIIEVAWVKKVTLPFLMHSASFLISKRFMSYLFWMDRHMFYCWPKQVLNGCIQLLTVDYRIKVHMDLQADKSPVVVKGPFFPRVVNPRSRIRGQCATQGFNLVKQGKLSYEELSCI
jgi:hypothetical protein